MPHAFDKLPPQNLDAERSVLGCMMLNTEAIDEVADFLKPEHFYRDSHRRIASVIFHLAESTAAGIDAVTVAEELERRKELAEVDGAPYLAGLMESVPHAAHARHYAEIVHEKYVLRSLQSAALSILREASDESTEVDDQLNAAEQKIFSIVEQQTSQERIEIREILADALAGIAARLGDKSVQRGVHCGFTQLDDLTAGLNPQSLVILAARPSMGKTAFVCNIANAVATHAIDASVNGSPGAKPKGVVIFSLEQSKLELVERLLCIRAKFNGHQLRKGELSEDDHERLLQEANWLSNLPIYIDDKPGRSVAQIAAISRRVKRRYGLGLVVIDYLQLIEPEDRKAPREQQVAAIARRLKFLAKELDVPVLALAQLNRAVDLRQDKQPRLADLRESGAIEQDADIVMFLHRPDAYDPDDRPGEVEVIVAKNRNGPTGIAQLVWLRESLRFADRADSHHERYLGGLPFQGDKDF